MIHLPREHKAKTVRLKDLSWPCKVAVIMSWVVGCWLVFWFLVGVMLGVMVQL